MRGHDDLPVLMSAPNADAPILARLELGEDSITFELHHPSYGVGILEVGFRDRAYFYRLAETGYTLAVDPGDVPMFLFLLEAADGKRYRWYVHSENPTQTFIQINEHVEAKAKETATAPAPGPTTSSLTDPLLAENEHEPTDKADPKPDAAVIPHILQQAAFSLGQAA